MEGEGRTDGQGRAAAAAEYGQCSLAHRQTDGRRGVDRIDRIGEGRSKDSPSSASVSQKSVGGRSQSTRSVLGVSLAAAAAATVADGKQGASHPIAVAAPCPPCYPVGAVVVAVAAALVVLRTAPWQSMGAFHRWRRLGPRSSS